MTMTQLSALGGCILLLLLAAAKIDMDDAMGKCTARGHSYATCHAGLYR